jgi:hypothetical protein
MSSMAVAGLVKSLIAVTVMLSPAAAHHASGHRGHLAGCPEPLSSP